MKIEKENFIICFLFWEYSFCVGFFLLGIWSLINNIEMRLIDCGLVALACIPASIVIFKIYERTKKRGEVK